MGNSPSSGGERHPEDGGGGRPEPVGGGESRRSLASRGLSYRITGGGSNNNVHRSGLPHISLPSPFSTRGSLGLSKTELDERCKPSG